MVLDRDQIYHAEIAELLLAVQACHIVTVVVFRVRVVAGRTVSYILLQQFLKNPLIVYFKAFDLLVVDFPTVTADLALASRAIVESFVLQVEQMVATWADCHSLSDLSITDKDEEINWQQQLDGLLIKRARVLAVRASELVQSPHVPFPHLGCPEPRQALLTERMSAGEHKLLLLNPLFTDNAVVGLFLSNNVHPLHISPPVGLALETVRSAVMRVNTVVAELMFTFHLCVLCNSVVALPTENLNHQQINSFAISLTNIGTKLVDLRSL